MKAKLKKLDFSNGKKLIKTATGIEAMVESSEELVKILREDSEKFTGKQYDSDRHFMYSASDRLLFLQQLIIRTDNPDVFVASLAKYGLIKEHQYS